MLTPWKESYDQPRQHIKKQRRYFANKGSSSQGYDFSSGHVWMWGLDYKESWVLKNWCFWTVVLEKTLQSPLDCQEIQSVHPKGDQSWVFIGRTDVEAETSTLWPPASKSWLIGKDPDAGKYWGQEEKGTRGWDGWMASLTQWTWVWVDCGSWWWTGRPGVLWFMGPQRVRYDWVTELNWTELGICPGLGLIGHMAVLFLIFLRKFTTVPHSGSINLHSHQQHKRVPFPLHLFQHLLFADFLMMVIL